MGASEVSSSYLEISLGPVNWFHTEVWVGSELFWGCYLSAYPLCPGHRVLWSLSADVSKVTRGRILPPFQQRGRREQILCVRPKPSFPPSGNCCLPWAPIRSPFPGSSMDHTSSLQWFYLWYEQIWPIFFPPSKTGLLGPKPDMFSQLGKGEEWMPEDSLGGFCLGKHAACGRHWEEHSTCARPVDWETSIFSLHVHLNTLLPYLSPRACGTPFLWQFVPPWILRPMIFLLSLFGIDGQLPTVLVCPVPFSIWPCSLCSHFSSEEEQHRLHTAEQLLVLRASHHVPTEAALLAKHCTFLQPPSYLFIHVYLHSAFNYSPPAGAALGCKHHTSTARFFARFAVLLMPSTVLGT